MLNTRSLRADVRNPMLALPSTRRLAEWLDANTARVLGALLADVAKDAAKRAADSWLSHKAPMACYWKMVSVYARHTSRAVRHLADDVDAGRLP